MLSLINQLFVSNLVKILQTNDHKKVFCYKKLYLFIYKLFNIKGNAVGSISEKAQPSFALDGEVIVILYGVVWPTKKSRRKKTVQLLVYFLPEQP